ncbi:ABC transporter ATP-binding protein [Clostridium beijerinckii]|uniref:ABC transporter ATP-binding protein n=1 Tax=Clostridium beijerinckii TaxID=1520 RepID=A0A1S9N0B7_CLOBE|nr:ABC transporter ATP-binding protein [Clostridium beijerinckii]MZK51924.1 ATP-binding cassette domain-containing protein [Clostridium beijerinckii]MZK58540.1 ATP-binding cassette domain-containing protein [Clostridium beijerinckii]MZK68888.1 ATP-binding cassette domain-containing protein [Clostridium beijerinckii]MZK74259.1 ATP-binding cassette domain-containing protein [Clostridium beijerinckii]MZK83960.1 ATP-binding cassette domain-containing protein [Clostridium beijerinckii]
MIKLFRFLKQYTVNIIIIVLLVFTQVIANLYLPTLMADIVDKGIVQKDVVQTISFLGYNGEYSGVDYILRIGGLMLLVSLGGAICAIIASFLSSRTAIGFAKIIRNKLFTKVESFSLNEFDKFGTATLITRTTNDVTQVQSVTIMMFSIALFAPLTALGGVVMALRENVTLTWIFAVVIPLLAVIIGLTLKFAMPLFKLMQVKIDKLNLVLRESLTGIRVVRAFNRINTEKVRFDDANKDLMNNAIKVNKIMAILMPIMMFIMNATTVAVIWFGSIRIDSGNMEVGSLIAFMQYGMQILFGFLMLGMVFIMIPRAQASAVRINEVLDMESEIVDPKKPLLNENEGGYVEFKDVSFSYPGAEQEAISNISFSAKPGEVTAIIGGTGSGKSTLINMIPRFYDVTNGSVLVDGIDVREMSQESIRAKIGFVPQKTVLFSGTIAENIKYGKDDASMEEIKHAAEVAQATDFINGMDDGYEHLIAQGGTNVSGGQKQRLSIARALVRKPEIYIFDDSFSALDFKTDARLRAALKKETVKSTVILVAQRVATVMDADRIIVLDEGQIAGIGTHKELLNSCKVYSEIVSSQLSEEELS